MFITSKRGRLRFGIVRESVYVYSYESIKVRFWICNRYYRFYLDRSRDKVVTCNVTIVNKWYVFYRLLRRVDYSLETSPFKFPCILIYKDLFPLLQRPSCAQFCHPPPLHTCFSFIVLVSLMFYLFSLLLTIIIPIYTLSFVWFLIHVYICGFPQLCLNYYKYFSRWFFQVFCYFAFISLFLCDYLFYIRAHTIFFSFQSTDCINTMKKSAI